MDSTLDVPGSREIIERLVTEYENAINVGEWGKALDAKRVLDRWSWPLARWYLDRTRREDNEKVHRAE